MEGPVLSAGAGIPGGPWKTSPTDKGTQCTSKMLPMIIASWGYYSNISFFVLHRVVKTNNAAFQTA